MTLDYELAKALKDAGFPLYDGRPVGMGRQGVCGEGQPRCLVVPTLEELIFEVHRFSHEVQLQALRERPGVWAAATCWGNGYEDDWRQGNTPSEALAKLWLTLSRENAETAQ